MFMVNCKSNTLLLRKHEELDDIEHEEHTPQERVYEDSQCLQ